MSYRVDPHPMFWAPVEVSPPGGGQKETFKARFMALETDEFNAVDLSDPASVRGFMEKVFVDCDEVEDITGKPAAWSEALRDQLIRIPHVLNALMTAYAGGFIPARKGN